MKKSEWEKELEELIDTSSGITERDWQVYKDNIINCVKAEMREAMSEAYNANRRMMGSFPVEMSEEEVERLGRGRMTHKARAMKRLYKKYNLTEEDK